MRNYYHQYINFFRCLILHSRLQLGGGKIDTLYCIVERTLNETLLSTSRERVVTSLSQELYEE